MSNAEMEQRRPQPDASQQAHSPSPSVTSIRERNKERKRLQRERGRPIFYERDDWQLFLDPDTLPQKAGCQPNDLAALVLKELVDNALDAGVGVTLTSDGKHWIVRDDGPGIDPEQIPDLFAVNRKLRSSKLKRLPTRGMLGNGLRVVMAWARTLTIETRGVRLALQVDPVTGHTTVIHREKIAETRGLAVILGTSDERDGWLAQRTIELAGWGFVHVESPFASDALAPIALGAIDIAAPPRIVPSESSAQSICTLCRMVAEGRVLR